MTHLTDPHAPTRAELSRFLSDQRSIKAFEKLFKLVPSEFNGIYDLIESVSLAASTAPRFEPKTEDVIMPSLALPVADVLDPIRQERIEIDQFYPAPPPQSLIDSAFTVNGDLILPKTSGKGIRVDKVDPTFGWRDLLGVIQTRPAAGGGASAIPDYVVYRGSIYQYRFGTIAPNKHLHETFIDFHLPHDYVSGTDVEIHAHWSQIVVDTGGPAGVPGESKWYFDVTYAKGHGIPGGVGDPFIAPITVSVVQQASATQYGHMIAVAQLSSAGGGGGLLDSNNFEPDGMLLARIYRDPDDASDTLNQDVFLHEVDMHYQTTNIGTKNPVPPFYD